MSKLFRSIITFLMGSAFFVVLPLLGWGLADIGGLLHNTARLIFFVLVCILNAFAAMRIPEIGKKGGGHKITVRRQHVAVIVFQALSIALVVVAPYCDRRSIATIGASVLVRSLGLILYSIGFLLMHFAEWYLGKLFSVEVVIQEEHKLVTEGPYRCLRHPRYLGMILFTIGIAMVFRSWIGLALAAVTAAMVFWRIHDEEILMQKQFGTDWDNYANKRWRLIPFIY